jgi:hypothetical protein
MKNFIFFTETPAKLHSSGRWLHHRSSQTPPKHTNDHSILHEISQGNQIRAWFVQKRLETGKTNATKFEHKNGISQTSAETSKLLTQKASIHLD